MCFSAEASFAAAACLGAVGALAVRSANDSAGLRLAAIPLVFAVQQSTEGLIWLSLAGVSLPAEPLAAIFLGFALVFWPVYLPVTTRLADPAKRRLHGHFVVLGSLTAAILAWVLLTRSYTPVVVDHCIAYRDEGGGSLGDFRWLLLPYALSVAGCLIGSSSPRLRAMGGTVAVGLAITGAAFAQATVSVWCFFAALSSLFVLSELRARHADRAIHAGTAAP